MTRYNAVNRWVIGDMIRRSAYHYPDKPALIDGDISRTYSQLEDDIDQTAQALLGLGVQKIRPRGHPGPQHLSPTS